MKPVQILFHRLTAVLALLCLGLLPVAPSLADNLRIVELNDGSQIAGEIVLFEHGVYTIESDSLGRLHIPDSDIRAIRSGSPAAARSMHPPAPTTAPQAAQGLTGYETQILGDPEILSMVMTLQQDPDVLAVLNDPAVMQAIAARDFQALQNNAKILKLETNPTIRRILDLVDHR